MNGAHTLGPQGSRQQKQQEGETLPSLSVLLLLSVRSIDATSGLTITQTVTLAQAPSELRSTDAGSLSS